MGFRNCVSILEHAFFKKRNGFGQNFKKFSKYILEQFFAFWVSESGEKLISVA